jgi:hypothetical protein
VILFGLPAMHREFLDASQPIRNLGLAIPLVSEVVYIGGTIREHLDSNVFSGLWQVLKIASEVLSVQRLLSY